MNTDLQSLIELSMPTFAHDRLLLFSEHEVGDRIVQRRHYERATVDLSRVIGTDHPDYGCSSWLELIGSPVGSDNAHLKRIRSRLADLRREPEYYLGPQNLSGWSFFLIEGSYFISGGVHRTVIARFFLAGNGYPQVVSGIPVTELTLRPPKQPQIDSNSFLNRLRRRLMPNPSIERTSQSGLRPLCAAPHVERSAATNQ